MESKSLDELTDQLSEKHTSYILITCDKAESDGKMQVQMQYEGDIDLVSCLIDGARSVIDDELPQPEESLRLVK